MKKIFIIAVIFCAILLCSCRKSYTCRDKAGSTIGTFKGSSKDVKKQEKQCNCTCTAD